MFAPSIVAVESVKSQWPTFIPVVRFGLYQFLLNFDDEYFQHREIKITVTYARL